MNTFLIQCHISEAVKHAVISKWKAVCKITIKEAKNLLVETSIINLIKIDSLKGN